MKIQECALTPEVLDILLQMSRDWEAENSCRGYAANEEADIAGNRIFLAIEQEAVLGYLFGHRTLSKGSSSVMEENTPCFEVEEIYVRPAFRSQGIGRALFDFAAQAVREEAAYILLSTATKNWKAILHFYLEELGMEFWSARLFKKI